MALPSAHPSPPPKTSSLSVVSSLPPPKRQRGGQPGNQNARKYGTFSVYQPGLLMKTRIRIESLQRASSDGSLPPQAIIELAGSELEKIDRLKSLHGLDGLATAMAEVNVIKLLAKTNLTNIPCRMLQCALESIAHDPFGYFERYYADFGISRDADSFFVVPKLSARNSLILPSPNVPTSYSQSIWGGAAGGAGFATSLTDEQWSLIAPLIPPDSSLDCSAGLPPVIVAANCLGFTRYSPTGEFGDFLIMEKYREHIRQHPLPPHPALPAVKRGRPRRPSLSPRALLDAILWKLATGHTWHALPFDFPPMRLCCKYYHRLFLSGRLYTILLALYNHMRLEAGIDPYLLLEQDVFTTTPSQHIALSPQADPTWQNYTALLFMQLARESYLHFERQQKRADPRRFLGLVLRGDDELSDGRLPRGWESKASPDFEIEPLESSSASRKLKQVEKRERCIRERLKKVNQLTSPLSRQSDRDAAS